MASLKKYYFFVFPLFCITSKKAFAIWSSIGNIFQKSTQGYCYFCLFVLNTFFFYVCVCVLYLMAKTKHHKKCLLYSTEYFVTSFQNCTLHRKPTLDLCLTCFHILWFPSIYDLVTGVSTLTALYVLCLTCIIGPRKAHISYTLTWKIW